MIFRHLPLRMLIGLVATCLMAELCPGDGVTRFANPDATQKTIPDFNGTVNTLEDTLTISAQDILNIGPTGEITNVAFTIEGLMHSWLGDLTVRVRHTAPGGATRQATLFERVGITDQGTNGIDNQHVDGTGDDSDFFGSYRFEDSGNSLWTTAAGLGDNDVVPFTNGTTPSYTASGAGNGAVGIMSIFAGNPASRQLSSLEGDWTFTFSDRANIAPNSNVGGSFTRTNIIVQYADAVAIPEPTSAGALLSLLIPGLLRRRRTA